MDKIVQNTLIKSYKQAKSKCIKLTLTKEFLTADDLYEKNANTTRAVMDSFMAVYDNCGTSFCCKR